MERVIQTTKLPKRREKASLIPLLSSEDILKVLKLKVIVRSGLVDCRGRTKNKKKTEDHFACGWKINKRLLLLM